MIVVVAFNDDKTATMFWNKFNDSFWYAYILHSRIVVRQVTQVFEVIASAEWFSITLSLLLLEETKTAVPNSCFVKDNAIPLSP